MTHANATDCGGREYHLHLFSHRFRSGGVVTLNGSTGTTGAMGAAGDTGAGGAAFSQE